MKKHAFLIIAHKDDKNFRTLLSLLDDERNDLFIHMDKKNRDYNIKMIESFVKHANVFHAKRYKVFWGSFSMVKAELSLLQKATREGTYEYYHLVSGNDLHIKSMDFIHRFFDEHKGSEFIGVVKKQIFTDTESADIISSKIKSAETEKRQISFILNLTVGSNC